MKKILLLLVIIPINLFSQNIIWSEDFESYTNGTQNATKWTTIANNCDNDGAPGIVADNYWGTRTTFGDKEFCCEDIEGLTCCSSGTSGEGNSDNVWLSEIIDISGNQNISISITMRAEGNMECTLCGTGNDQFTSQYQIDGGSWITFLSVCGFADGQSILECVDVGTGTNLRLRVLLGNQANTEEYYFDDVFVYEGNCAIVLPVQLSSFSATELEDGNKIEWITESENGSSHFELYKSVDGQNWQNIATLSGAMNTTQTQRYIHIDNEISSVINYYKLFQFDVDGEFETFGPISVQNSLGKVIIGNENIIGQKVNKDYRGLVVVIWSDGSKELIFRP